MKELLPNDNNLNMLENILQARFPARCLAAVLTKQRYNTTNTKWTMQFQQLILMRDWVILKQHTIGHWL